MHTNALAKLENERILIWLQNCVPVSGTRENKTQTIHHTPESQYQLYHLEQLHCQYYYLNCRFTVVMDFCIQATSSTIDNKVEPPTLSQVSDSIPDFHQGKMNVTISEMDPTGYGLEPTNKTDIDKNIDEFETTKNNHVKLQPI